MHYSSACPDIILYSFALFLLVFRMHLNFKLSVYFGFLIISSVQMSLALSLSDTEESLKDNNQVSRTEERLVDAFEEQVRTI